MTLILSKRVFAAPLLVLAMISAGFAADAVQAADDPVLKALGDEIARSMTLQLEDLEKPYFVQYAVDDTTAYRISATCGSIVSSDRARSRLLYTQVRVGSYELDNTNFGGGGMGGFGRRGGGRNRGGGSGRGATRLPIDGNDMAIRHEIWTATDSAYKSAVETLAQKRSYIEDREVSDRPNDFSKQEPVQAIAPLAELSAEALSGWEDNLKRLSARFLDFDFIQNATAEMTAGARNEYLVNSEGTRLRQGNIMAMVRITADALAADGENISDSIEFLARSPEDLPAMDEILAAVDDLAKGLSKAIDAPLLEEYIGPVLFDGTASPQLFQDLISRGVAASAGPVGGGRRRFSAMEDLSKYLGKRILPRSFQVYDDPSAGVWNNTILAGHFAFDNEGVRGRRVDIIVDGTLKGLLTCRTPTKDFDLSNGHGRRPGLGATAQASVGCLFVSSTDGLSADALKSKLIEIALDQGLDYALRIASLRSRAAGRMGSMADMRAMFTRQQRGGGGGSALSDPLFVYKVYVDDGREELVRGCEFGDISVTDLRRIAAVGDGETVYNRGGVQSGGVSIIAPGVILEEVELFGIEQDHAPQPVIAAPHAR